MSDLEASEASIVVVNEFESPQAQVVESDGDWALHRATPNNTMRDGNSGGNAIAWRKDTWKLATEPDEFTVAWQVTLHMPVVTLQNVQTGALVTVVGVHNPASTDKQGNQAGARTHARDIELQNIAALRAAAPVPVLLAGDMNERTEAFCGFTRPGFLKSSAGGSIGSSCSPPRHGPVDWIFGTTDVTFSSQVINNGTLGRLSDHPMLSTTVTIPEHQEIKLKAPAEDDEE
jgi:hypothetical protein